MREIKFRVWDANKKIMHSFGELGVLIDFGDLAGVSTRYSNSYMDDCYTDDAISAEESNDYRIMQYTGLKDKNGAEIYEGDIIEWDHYYFEGIGNGGTGYGEWQRKSGTVYFKEGMFCVSQEYALAMMVRDARIEDDGYEFEDDEETGWKVVGNIYT